ncbi:dynamin family protein [Caryophanon latum]|uniref:Dynamin N-terminal domain-containing protein n=1 Tax=Caryophanon latum TaxID=33977 RepID=A0A1C0YB40_9BACL|nr:dynamin family protein [Caryophanon latum]OCS84351.1 hypothetical protein A6K76_15710 [Caryophanon latum]
MEHLQHFEQTKNKLLKQIASISSYVANFSTQTTQKELQTVIDTLQREQFEVMVVGEFSNGKSTFINALLKNEVLPHSNVPTTALLNKIYYAKQPAFSVHYSNGKQEPLTKEQFDTFVSEDKQQMDGIASKIRQKLSMTKAAPTHLEVGYPTDLCRNNVVLIDSPGTNDMDEERVKITDEYIPRSDAAIFVLNANKIFSASEEAFLQRIMDADIKKIFFVINFKDLVPADQLKEVEDVFYKHVPTSIETNKVHFISALHALRHYVPQAQTETMSRRQQRKAQQQLPLHETGIVEFEDALKQFLTYDTGKEKLRKPIERTKRLLGEELDRVSFELQSLVHKIDDIDRHTASIQNQLATMKKDMKSKSSKLKQSIENQSQQIAVWYKKEAQNIIQKANDTANTHIQRGKDVNAIKTEIDLATAKMETKLKQSLTDRIEELLHNTVGRETTALQNEMTTMMDKLFVNAAQKADWSHIPVAQRKEQTSSNVREGAIIGGLIGGFLLALSGGTIGWGLLGGAAVGVAVTAYTSSNEDVYDELRKQVRKRYDKAYTAQGKEVEKQLAKLASTMQEQYENYTQQLIEKQTAKTKTLLNNQHLSLAAQQNKISMLEERQIQLRQHGEALTATLQNYSNNQGVKAHAYSTVN